MAGNGYPNGWGRLGFGTRDGWGKPANPNGAEVNQNDVKAMPGVIDCPDCHKDGAIADGFPNKGGGSYQSARDKPRAQESINNVQNAGSDGGRTSFPAGIFGRQKFDHGGYEVGADDMSTNGRNSPAYGRYEYSSDTLITTGGWTRPGRAGWVPLGKATNDIGTAAGYLRESASPSSGASRWNPASQPKKRDSVTTTIDSREAAKKYGGMLV